MQEYIGGYIKSQTSLKTSFWVEVSPNNNPNPYSQILNPKIPKPKPKSNPESPDKQPALLFFLWNLTTCLGWLLLQFARSYSITTGEQRVRNLKELQLYNNPQKNLIPQVLSFRQLLLQDTADVFMLTLVFYWKELRWGHGTTTMIHVSWFLLCDWIVVSEQLHASTCCK